MQITEEDFVKMIVALSEVRGRIFRASWQHFILGVLAGILYMLILHGFSH